MAGIRRAARLAPAAALAVALLAAGAGGARAAGEAGFGEYQVKAAFLRNFAKFVEWPSHRTGAITLCILGEDPFKEALQGSDDIGGGRTLGYRRIARLEDAGECQAVFVAAGERGRLPAILAALSGKEVLTIGDGEGTAQAGLMLGFILEQQKVRFEANLEPARRSGLTISSKLLSLARTVHNAR